MTTPNIMIVGEAFGEKEEELGQPFVGPSGRILNGMLRQVGIDRNQCFLTNVFNFRPAGNKLQSLAGEKSEALPGYPQLQSKLWIHRRYAPEIDRLFDEVRAVNPNVIIALGATPLWALFGQTGIKKYRGTPIIAKTGHKLFPTYHPAAIMRQWKLRPVALMDLSKAKREAEFPELRRPRRTICIEPTLSDIEDFIKRYIEPAPVVACDIETKNLGIPTITEIGFAPTVDRALVIPFWDRDRRNYWQTAADERRAWELVRHICETKPLVGQNFNYDIEYLWRCMGIRVNRVAGDTMILHHSMYPELEKGLGFLGSLYTSEPSWKFMRTDHDSYKDGD